MSTTGHENDIVDVSGLKSTMQAFKTKFVPSAATASNQLADKAFVNSSIATATATFRGTYNLKSDLSLNPGATHADIAAALTTKISSANPDMNDYAFVLIPTAAATPTEIASIERYKYIGGTGTTKWDYEYTLNNSGFTAAQWAAINSGITSAGLTSITSAINGLGTAANKGVDTSISSASSTNLPTTNAVKSYVASVAVNPISDSNISNSQSFSPRDIVNVNGEMYVCDTATTEYPKKKPIAHNGDIVTQDGKMVVLDETMSANWHSI